MSHSATVTAATAKRGGSLPSRRTQHSAAVSQRHDSAHCRHRAGVGRSCSDDDGRSEARYPHFPNEQYDCFQSASTASAHRPPPSDGNLLLSSRFLRAISWRCGYGVTVGGGLRRFCSVERSPGDRGGGGGCPVFCRARVVSSEEEESEEAADTAVARGLQSRAEFTRVSIGLNLDRIHNYSRNSPVLFKISSLKSCDDNF